MRSAKLWVSGALLLTALSGVAVFSTSTSLAQPGPREERREEQSYWRHHDGRWSHWDARDRRWYYTDGSHWYYHNGKNWEVYRFDKTFGREGFERGRYAPPTDPNVIVVPRHEVYVGPR